MNDYLILDLLFGVIVALFAAIGLWRGVVKEVAVTAAVFTGAALAAAWAQPWGRDLAGQTDISEDVAKMIVTGVALLGSTLVLGYGGGALLSNRGMGWGSRVTGGLLAAINGGLLLHFALDGVETFFTGESTREALDQSHVARLLLRQFGWILIGMVALLTLTMLVASVVRRGTADSGVDSDHIELPADHSASRGRPVRLPREADRGKFEPQASGFDPASGRYAADAPSIQQTIAIAPVDPRRVAYDGGQVAPQSEKAPRARYENDEWLRRGPYADRSTVPSAGNGHVSSSSPAPETSRSVDPNGWQDYPRRGNSAAGVTPNAAPFRAQRCPRCASVIGDGDDFCPECGNRIAAR